MKRTTRRTLQILGASALVMTLVWQRIEATSLGYSAEKSREEVQKLKNRVAVMDERLESSFSCVQLAAQAQRKLGMHPAPPGAERVLSDSPLAVSGRSFWLRLLGRAWRPLLSSLRT